jgi:GT2 family glycosyltransferase
VNPELKSRDGSFPSQAQMARSSEFSGLSTVSVLIPTKDRSADLSIAIRSLLAQSIMPLEILVADQSPDDHGRKLIEREFRDAPSAEQKAIRLLYLVDPDISGAAEARNRLMNLATGEIWLFLDDDVCLEEACIQKLLEVYCTHPQIDGVAGIITNYTKPARHNRLWSVLFDRGPFRDERQPIYWNAEALANSQVLRVTKFTGACMSFRARALGALRFDPRLTGGSLAEDIDLCARLSSHHLVIAPQARLIHKRSAVNRPREHWLREHAQSSYYMYRRNWNRTLKGRLSFLWLRLGYLAIVPAGCLRRCSMEPWRAFQQGVRSAIDLSA